MKQHIIDGNNLIGKIGSLSKLQKRDKQSAREQVAFLIQKYFRDKKVNVSYDSTETLIKILIVGSYTAMASAVSFSLAK